MLSQRSFNNRTLPVLVSAACVALAWPLNAQSGLTPFLHDVVFYNAPLAIGEVQTQYCSTRPRQDCWPNLNLAKETDHFSPVDFDLDVSGANNVTHLLNDYVPDRRPVVYFSIQETGSSSSEGFYYIGYYWYHPQDGGAYAAGFWIDEGHEHDMEGIFLIVKKSPYLPFGQPILALSEAHGALLPYGVPGMVDFDHTLSGGAGIGSWGGEVQFWTDANINHPRPIAAIRSGTHGTYLAQNCAWNSTSYYTEQYGAVVPQDNPNSMTACIHQGTNWILYVPSYWSDVPGMPADTYNGAWWYALVEVADSPMWTQRAVQGALFNGSLIDLHFGVQAYNIFQRADANESTANPPWAWPGGPGSRGGIIGYNGHWYSFSQDGTTSIHGNDGEWPTIPDGSLLMSPGVAAYLYFDRYPDAYNGFLNLPVTYNAYRAYDTPPCCDLSVSIVGPGVLTYGQSVTYNAYIVSGQPPFTYHWSGDFGSSDSENLYVTGYNEGDIFLDVWDGNGQHVAISKHILICSGPEAC